MTLVLVTAPSSEPVSLAEAKLHLRVDVTDDDALITALISAARIEAEHRTGRALMPQTWKLMLNGFPPGDRAIVLPKPPFVAVTSVAYIDADNAAQTLAAENYRTGQEGLLTALRPAWDTLWPSARDGANTVSVTFSAGYANAAAVPEAVKAWMKIAIATLYDNRAAILSGGEASEFAPRRFYDGLLDPYIVPSFA